MVGSRSRTLRSSTLAGPATSDAEAGGRFAASANRGTAWAVSGPEPTMHGANDRRFSRKPSPPHRFCRFLFTGRFELRLRCSLMSLANPITVLSGILSSWLMLAMIRI
jgi:hypothetical protein